MGRKGWLESMKTFEEGMKEGQIRMKTNVSFGRIIINQLNPQGQYDLFTDQKGKACYLMGGFEDNSFRIVLPKETFKISYHKVVLCLITSHFLPNRNQSHAFRLSATGNLWSAALETSEFLFGQSQIV